MRLITAKEASELLRVRLPRLYELARTKAIPTVKLGARQVRFDEQVLTEWANKGGSITNQAERNANNKEQRCLEGRAFIERGGIPEVNSGTEREEVRDAT